MRPSAHVGGGIVENGEFLFIFVWAIGLTSCFMYRNGCQGARLTRTIETTTGTRSER